MTSSPNRLGAVLLGALGLAYPFVVYGALGRVPAGALALVAVALAAARLGLLRRSPLAGALVPPVAAVAVATAALALADGRTAALAYPVLMSLGMAAAFGLSLRRGPTLIEHFARLAEPDPGPAARAYMRNVTRVWFVFLLGNAAVSAATAASGDLALWTLYNGLLSYLLMAALFTAEYGVRTWLRRRA
ncbi:hypothetical protein [Magnetospirillum sp. UT-4]|uniref:hypothetical protein n=1 Tax=Magnetospirillum sp. UT-4 TaxID=2681467 RepID=UPI001381988B|nr:hypothetical protein [Magnetospirillum sp. UT-4]CAA7626555.1 conserved membrane hypothetical protein [Magnetospirillum sp. UT-4]